MFYSAAAVNQPLSFDTSSVTTMRYMFLSAGAFNQPLSFDTSSVRDMGSMFWRASVVNQPLSFDTSSVTNMRYMFQVRSCPCPAPNLQTSPPVHDACTATARRVLPPLGPYFAPHRMPSVRLSAVRVGVQPAAELRHLQRHNHALHVQRALLPVACPQSAVEPSPVHAERATRSPAASRLPVRIPRPASYTLFSGLGRTRWRSTSR